MRILVADDDEMALVVIKSTLSDAGYEVTTAQNGEEALRILREGKCRLVISDWMMPRLTGLELCRAIRAEQFPGYVYVILLTACNGNQQRSEGLAAGADDFIAKPFNVQELIERVKTGERILTAERSDLHAEMTLRRRVEESLKARSAQQAVVAQLGQRALAGIDFKALLDEAMTQIIATLDIQFCHIMELLPERHALLMRAGKGWREGVVGSATASCDPETFFDAALSASAPFVIGDWSADLPFKRPQFLAEHGVAGAVGVVIAGPGSPYGVLGAYTTRRREFEPHDLEFLRAVANVLALALHHNRSSLALFESRERFKLITETIQDVLWITSTDCATVHYVSPAYQRMWGRPAEELQQHAWSWLGSVHPDDRSRVQLLFQNAAREGIDAEFRLQRDDGEIRWIWDRTFTVRDRVDGADRTVRVSEDVTDHKRRDDSHRRSQNELTAFLENATEGLHWADGDGIILWANHAELAMLGYSREEYVGHYAADFFVDPAVHEDVMTRLKNREELHNYHVVMHHKDGSHRHILIDANVLAIDGRFVHTQCFSRDITERKWAEEALLAQQSSLERANKDLGYSNQRLSELYQTAQRFVDNVSHEFRTPLTVIKGYAEALRDDLAGPINPEQREFLGFVIDRSRDLAQMVDDLLDTSKLRAGMLRIDRAPHGIEQVLAPVRPMLHAKATSNKIELIEELDADLPQVFVDAEKAGRVLVNLVVNAVKFSGDNKKVIIRARACEDGVDISVTDEGPGISPENMELLFERFRQLGDPQAATVKGFGLGLNIARELVALNLGEIRVSSVVGKGSTFSFTMPRNHPGTVLRCYFRYLKILGTLDGSIAALHARSDATQKKGGALRSLLATCVRAADLILPAPAGEALLILGRCSDIQTWSARLRQQTAAILAPASSQQETPPADDAVVIEAAGMWEAVADEIVMAEAVQRTLEKEHAYV